jgi:hypothetical protein
MNSEKFKKQYFMPTYHKLLILCFLIVLFLVCCTKNEDRIAPATLALVNGVSITKKELVNRLELTALPEFHKQGDRNKRALNLLIDELIVSQWAQAQGLINSSDYQELLEFIKQQALIRELFFEKIRVQAEPDSQQIHQALEKSMQQITVQTLFTKDDNIAAGWRKSLRSGKTFESLLKDSKGNYFVLVDSSSFHWGDGTIPIEIEQIAYQLELGRSSKLIKLNDGYGIITIVNKVRNIFLTPYDLSSKRQQVNQVLRARNESRLANEYVDQLLTHLNIIQRADGFVALMRYIDKKMFADSENMIQLPLVHNEEIQFPDLYLPVLETPDFTWTGKDILNMLRKYNFSIDTKNSKVLQNTLTSFLKVAVRDHYLSQQAEQLGLGSKKRVLEDTQIWGRYFLYINGIRAFIASDSTTKNIITISNWISELRANAQITINDDLLEEIELTGIPMVVFWNSDIFRQLATPPLMEF